MFTSWKGQLQSLVRAARLDTDEVSDPQVESLRRMLTDLRGDPHDPAHNELIRVDEVRELPALQIADAHASMAQPEIIVESQTAEDADELRSAMQRFVGQQRLMAEALLSEICALEERVKAEVLATEAARECAIADENARSAGARFEESKQLIESLSKSHMALMTQRAEVEGRLAAVCAELGSANDDIAVLERRLREAKVVGAEVLARFDLLEAQAKECVDADTAAALEEGAALRRLAACERDAQDTLTQAEAAKARAATLKSETSSFAGGAAGLEQVRSLAERIAAARPPQT
ncbi:MAG TPA: hypothetical protein VGX91_08655 [Candidatus Cybelea sp.]|nr:hypothetical protein [Candidatus Cybelea sp.]